MNRYDIRALPPPPPDKIAAYQCADCHLFGVGSEMLIVYDREQHTASVLCETCAQKRGATGHGGAMPREEHAAQ